VTARIVFSINPGRSGSWYLGKLLDTAAGARGFHEAAPQMTGPYVRMVNEHAYEDTYELRWFKAAAVQEFIARHRPAVYADSSHMFIKTFHDVAVRELAPIEVVLLRRPLAQVLRSFVQLSFFHRHPTSLDWMTSPNAVTAALRCVDEDGRLDHYDRCIAYLLDIGARAQRFKIENPQVPVHEVTVEDLNSRAGVEDLFDRLGITVTARTLALVGTRVNERRQHKGRLHQWPTVRHCRMRIDRYVARAQALDIEMPPRLVL
jgi:hypothetical protein